MHRLLKLLISHPELLVAHASAYAELAGDDALTVAHDSFRSAFWTAAMLCCISAAVILAGGAVMIWATLPEGAIRLPWVLLVTPWIPAAAALGCQRVLKPKVQPIAFAKVRQQIVADTQMLQGVNAP